MSKLWVPPKVRESTEQHRADLRAQMSFQNVVSAAWNPELQKVDPYLRLAKAHDDAHMVGVRPGFYHLVRLNPEAPPWVQPLTGPDGEFVEPSSRMLDTLRASDLQNARVLADRKAAEKRAEEAKARERARDDEERLDEMVDRFKSLENTSISVSRSIE